MPHVRSPQRLDTRSSAVWVIDLQEKLCPAIPDSRLVLEQTHRLLEASKILEVPFAATVQYPTGLGPLEASLRSYLPEPEEKRAFSATLCRDALDRWRSENRDQIVIVGVETHVCVLQTVLDLIAEDVKPFVVVDAVAARKQIDHDLALQRMRESGAVITTLESVLFEWLETSDQPQFKAISKIIKS